MAQRTGRVGSSPRERGIQRHYVRLPGLTVGRCWPRKFCATIHSEFQSAPGLTVGRCLERDPLEVIAQVVSIHARPHGRAMRHTCNLLIVLCSVTSFREPALRRNLVAMFCDG